MIGPARFALPSAVFETSILAEVVDVLDRAEQAAKAGHWVVGFVSYQAAPGLDADLRVPGVAGLPLVWFGVYDVRLADVPDRSGPYRLGEWTYGMTRSVHAAKVEEIRHAIIDGDTYQANLTFPITTEFGGSTEALFSTMVSAQPDSYAAHIDTGSAQVLSVSPELFLKKDGRRVTSRPMKGTAPRGRFGAEDQKQANKLASSEKERAGNVMIVDMIRNDLGRVAESGSVQVVRLCEPERYRTVWQLTSTVSVELRSEVGLVELFKASFPSGSVTGAPKVFTMRIITDQEEVARDVYCGAIGYIAPGGHNAEFSVAIRTGVVTGDRFAYHVGGGITSDSTAAIEYEECLWKALVVTEPDQVPGLVETMRYQPEVGIPLLDRHLARLVSSADYWEIECDTTTIEEALSSIRPRGPAKVRLVLSPSGRVEITVEPIVDVDEPVPLTISVERIDTRHPYWFHKTEDRSRYPSTEAGNEVVLANLEGEVTETNISNLMVRFGEDWFTPPITSGCLPGVYRALLIDQGRITSRKLTVDDLWAADELAVTNAVRGWRKAVLLEEVVTKRT